MTKAIRWDPKSRAGAMSIHPKHNLDVDALKNLAENLQEVASYQEMGGGEWDTHEPSPVAGTYDWRGYLREESEIAWRREQARTRANERRAPPPKPKPTNWRLYA